jgi:hypothetical protein
VPRTWPWTRLRKPVRSWPPGRETYGQYADANILPAYWLYFDHRFQVNVLATMDDVIGAIRSREAELGHHYQVIDLRDFANPVTAVMGRTPARGISIGGDPYRAVLPPTQEEIGSPVPDRYRAVADMPADRRPQKTP